MRLYGKSKAAALFFSGSYDIIVNGRTLGSYDGHGFFGELGKPEIGEKIDGSKP